MSYEKTQNNHPLYDSNRIYFDTLIKDFSNELNKGSLREITNNPTLIGAYAENLVNKMIKRVLVNSKISSGAVLSIANERINQIFNNKIKNSKSLKNIQINDINEYLLRAYKKKIYEGVNKNINENKLIIDDLEYFTFLAQNNDKTQKLKSYPESIERLGKYRLKQLDTILWSANHFPPAFENESFAIVPKPSVLGIIEIKNTNYPSSISSIQETIENTKHLFSTKSINKTAIGLIPFKLTNHCSDKLEKQEDEILVLSEKKNKRIVANEKGFIRLINYLNNVNKASCNPNFYGQITT